MLRNGDRKNFDTLLKAARNGDLALIEGKDTATGEYRAILCAVHREGDQFVISPLGHLATDDPYKQYSLEET